MMVFSVISNIISAYYDGLFGNFKYYKCLYSNAPKHLKMMHKYFLNTYSSINNLLNKVFTI